MTDIADPRTPSRLSGQVLAAFRQAIGLTQTALAQAAGLSRHTVCRWEQKAAVDVEQSTFERLIGVLMPPGPSQALRPLPGSGDWRSAGTGYNGRRSHAAPSRRRAPQLHSIARAPEGPGEPFRGCGAPPRARTGPSWAAAA